jgi:hypothetical protein
LALAPEQVAELDRRFAEHQADPGGARSFHDPHLHASELARTLRQ